VNDDTTLNIASGGSTLSITGTVNASARTLTKTGSGAVRLNNVRSTGLVINAGSVVIPANGTDTGTSRVGSLNVGPNGTFDLTDNNLIVTAGSYAAVSSAIAAARNGGQWNQPGITSSTAGTANPRNETLGVLTGTQLLSTGVTTFDGFSVSASDVLVKFTYYGDTDFNGIVNFDDYARIDSGFNNTGNTWFQGDFDLNGLINFDDYALIDLAFNTQGPALRSVPEPDTALSLAGLAAVVAGARRGRRR
jgi:hypothetical protein